MHRPTVFFLFLFSFTGAALQSQSGPTARREVQSTIVAMERAALDRSDKGDPAGFLEISDPEVTYFDPYIEQPIHGLETLRAYYRKYSAPVQSSGEMSHVQVQVTGNAAVLTFNYTSKSSRRVTRWNATEVYRRGIKGWRIVHTHWSYLKPQLAQPD